MSIKGTPDELSTFPLAFSHQDPSPADPPLATGHARPICLLVQGVTQVLLVTLAACQGHSTAIPPSNEAPLDNCGYYPLCLDLFKPFCYKPHQISKLFILRPAEVDASHYGFNRGLFDDY